MKDFIACRRCVAFLGVVMLLGLLLPGETFGEPQGSALSRAIAAASALKRDAADDASEQAGDAEKAAPAAEAAANGEQVPELTPEERLREDIRKATEKIEQSQSEELRQRIEDARRRAAENRKNNPALEAPQHQPGNGNDPDAAEDTGQEESGGDQLPLFLEDSPAAEEKMREAERLRQDARLPDAVAVYQEIIEEFPNKLIKKDSRLHIDARYWVEQELRRDQSLLDLYRRLLEPVAQRELAEAHKLEQPLAYARGMQRVIEHYGLCAAGLEAAFELTGYYLEKGQPIDAAAVLDMVRDHPDLQAHHLKWHYLQAAIGIFSEQPSSLQDHLTVLNEAGLANQVAQLHAWQRVLQKPVSAWSSQSKRSPVDANIPESLEKPLWKLDATIHTAEGDPRNQQLFRSTPQIQNIADTFTIVPEVDESSVYLNTNLAIMAIDRFSKDALWTYGGTTPSANVNRGLVHFDRRSVLRTDNRIYGIVGLLSGQSIRWGISRGMDTTLACLDIRTGEAVWEVTAAGLDESLANGYFHGTPLAGPGRIYALVRRNQTGFYESFIVALDSQDGSLLWRRHLASASSPQNSEAFPFSQMTVDAQDRLFIMDNLGTVSSIDGRTGAVHWLNIIRESHTTIESRLTSANRRGRVNYHNPPVILPAGLLLNSYAYPNALLLDINSGQIIENVTDATINQSMYLMAYEEDLLAVGEDIKRLDGRTLEVKWRHHPQPRGRVYEGLPAITRDAIWLPRGQELLVLSLHDGEQLHKDTLELEGNVVAYQSQVIVAGKDFAHSYMQWDVAYDAVIRQIEENPHDPTRGLALSRMALATDRPEIMIQGIDHAITALESARLAAMENHIDEAKVDQRQQTLFDYLRNMTDRRIVRDVEVRKQLFERLAAVVKTPEQQVWYLIDLGDYYVETRQYVEAVAQYQLLLENQKLASQVIHEKGSTHVAGLSARERLGAILEKNPALYQPYSDKADRLFAGLSADEKTKPEEFVDMARQFPFAKSASRARMAAADRQVRHLNLRDGEKLKREDQIQIMGAVEQLRNAYIETSDPEMVQEIVSRLGTWLELAGRPRMAMSWLKRAKRDYPTLQVLRDQEWIALEKWINELDSLSRSSVELPQVALPLGKPFTVSGQLMTPIGQPRAEWPRDAMITIDENHKAQYRTGGKLDIRWEMTFKDPNTQLLTLTDEQALFWLPSEGNLVSVDPQTGKQDWDTVGLTDLFSGIAQTDGELNNEIRVIEGLQGEVRIRRGGNDAPMIVEHGPNGELIIRPQNAIGRDHLIQQRLGSAMARNTFFQINETLICAADKLGRVVAIDRASGEVRWQSNFDFREVMHFQASGDSVVIGGIDTQRGRGRIVALDIHSGQPYGTPLDYHDHIRWIAIGGPGYIVGWSDQITAYDMADNSVVWMQKMSGDQMQVASTQDDQVLFLMDINSQSSAVIALNPHTGEPLATRVGLSGQVVQGHLQRVGETWHGLSSKQVYVVDAQGALLWRDAIFDNEKFLQDRLVGKNHVLVLAGNEMPQPQLRVEFNNGEVRRRFMQDSFKQNYRLYVLDRHTGKLVKKQEITGLGESVVVGQTQLLDNRIILSTTTRTLVIPGHSGDERNQ